jgi:hypothetical protein
MGNQQSNSQNKFISDEELLYKRRPGSAVLNNNLTQYVRVWCKSKFTLFYDFTIIYPTTLEVVLNKGTLVTRDTFNLDYSDFGEIKTKIVPCVNIRASQMKVVSDVGNNIFSFFGNTLNKKYYATSAILETVHLEIGKIHYHVFYQFKSSKYGVLFSLGENSST